jgi:L-aspartate oxidase
MPALRTLRAAMSRDAGVVRDADGLTRLVGVITDLEGRHGGALPLIAARLVADNALARRESRGAHYRADFPHLAPVAERSFVTLSARTFRAAEGQAA